MLKLKLDVKCGYENRYVVCKGYSYDISYLANPVFYEKLKLLLPNKFTEFAFMSEEDMFLTYKDKPVQLLKDYKLGSLLYNIISMELSAVHFPEITDPQNSPIVFPELFVLGNYQLILTDEVTDMSLLETFLDEFISYLPGSFISDLYTNVKEADEGSLDSNKSESEVDDHDDDSIKYDA